jgi:hypothetical protein
MSEVPDGSAKWVQAQTKLAQMLRKGGSYQEAPRLKKERRAGK